MGTQILTMSTGQSAVIGLVGAIVFSGTVFALQFSAIDDSLLRSALLVGLFLSPLLTLAAAWQLRRRSWLLSLALLAWLALTAHLFIITQY